MRRKRRRGGRRESGGREREGGVEEEKEGEEEEKEAEEEEEDHYGEEEEEKEAEEEEEDHYGEEEEEKEVEEEEEALRMLTPYAKKYLCTIFSWRRMGESGGVVGPNANRQRRQQKVGSGRVEGCGVWGGGGGWG